MLQKTITIMACSRVFSLPMTILSWMVVFVYALVDSGSALNGIIALIGLCFAHLGTNLVDDYFDYKSLIKQVGFNKAEYLKNSQKTKCRYLINGILKENDILVLAGLYFLFALSVGALLFIKCGVGVLYYTAVGAIIAIAYPFISRICLSEVAVALAYGPALFGGVFYVMTGLYSWEVVLLSVPTMIMTVVLLYIHTVMDYDYDKNEGKRTLANSFENSTASLIILKILLTAAYLSVILLCIFDIADWQVFLVLFTLPLSIDLYKSMYDFTKNPLVPPVKKWYHLPMENMKNYERRGEAGFMVRIYQSRNLMIYFSILLALGLIFSLAI